ncbi:hypothetical protein BP5796_09785 [Coleophoma crateriformis]|uniref:Rhodopsin domain-containing protein n=1 Tax=Coleophoma crateriformis TaxID=565419 RepID=A0A3D8QZ10_9HELO|nr:hypothetical protein BP5796_09785 [Coleophoma crateriformis]
MPTTTTYEWPIPIENSGQIGALTASSLCIFLSSVFVFLRLFAKQLMGRTLDWSDYCILAAWCFSTALHIDDLLMVCVGGFGFHVTDIVTRFGTDVLLCFYKGITAFPILWNACICFSKLSVLLMYTAIIPIRALVLPARFIGLFIILWNASSIIAAFALCQPFSYNWDQTGEGHCGSQPSYYFWLGIINVITDVLILALPMPFIYNLQMRLQKKLLLLGMFSIGIITCGITIYRQTMIPHLVFTDMTYSGILATVLSGVEPTVAIILACVPFLRPLFGKGASTEPTSYNLSDGATGAFSKKAPVSSEARPFEELDDDSSDIQLRPVDEPNAQVVAYSEPLSTSPRDKSTKSQFITVQTQWQVNYKQEEERNHV